MKFSIFSLCFLGLFLFSSCNKEESKTKDFFKDDYKDEFDDKECFEMVYPVSYTMPDNSTISGEDEEELWSNIKVWYENNPDSEEKPALVYPVEVIFGDGTAKTIEEEATMILVKKDCDPGKCFDLVYPISFTMPDGSTLSLENKEEWKTSFDTWYENNPDSEEKPTLDYPVNIIFEDGTTKTVDDETAMIVVKKDCKVEEIDGN